MEKCKNRLNYLEDLPFFIENVELSDQFLKKVNEHQIFKNYRKPLQKLPNDKKLSFILLELTRQRSTCAQIINILQDCGQTEVADRLAKFNKSQGPMELSTEVEIEVTSTAAPIGHLSKTYNLCGNPRGKCIIINNVEDPQSPNVYDENLNCVVSPKGLKRETIRFEHIFKELKFNVEVITKLSATQMEERLTQISKDKSLEKDDSFVLIVISHGYNKKVLGYNACEANRQMKFGEIPENDENAIKTIRDDMIAIKDVVNIFSEDKDKCPQLSAKPKLFFFICCRNGDKEEPEYTKVKNFLDIPMIPSDIKEPIVKRDGKPTKNLDTFVSYSCAQGFKSIYDTEIGMSYFGLALTQSIAQYSCDESLSTIMNRTSKRLKDLYESYDTTNEKQKEEERKLPEAVKLEQGSFCIEVNTYSMDNELYFNPGF